MRIPQIVKQRACEGLLQMCPKKQLAQELGVSEGSLRDWEILIANDNFGWSTSHFLRQDNVLL